jgi:hypothetical protein
VEAHGQVLQLGVQRVAHARLDARARREHEPAAQRDHAGLEHAEPEHEPGERPDRARVAIGQRAVDDRLQHLRDREGDELRDEGGDHAGDDERECGAGVLAQAEERAHGSDARG